jgi:hypothetical protein
VDAYRVNSERCLRANKPFLVTPRAFSFSGLAPWVPNCEEGNHLLRSRGREYLERSPLPLGFLLLREASIRFRFLRLLGIYFLTLHPSLALLGIIPGLLFHSIDVLPMSKRICHYWGPGEPRPYGVGSGSKGEGRGVSESPLPSPLNGSSGRQPRKSSALMQ